MSINNLKLEVWEWHKNKNKHRFIGSCDFSLWDLHTDKKLEHRLQNDKTVIGLIKWQKCEIETKYTFKDFIFGGCEIRVVVAIDFTLTNKPINDPKSLHHIPSKQYDNFYLDEDGKKINSKNQYYKAIKRIWEIVNYYNTSSQLTGSTQSMYIPVYGFGSKLPPYYNSVSHWFALNGNIFDPEIEGVEGVWEMYKKMIPKIQFHGPSAMAPLIRFIKDYTCYEQISATNQFYTILLVFTNGELSDLQSTVDEGK